MNCLYRVVSKFSFEEYHRFNYALLNKKHAWFIIIALCVFFLLAGYFLKETWLIILAIIYPFIFWGVTESHIRKIFKSNKFYQDKEIEYEFYDEYFVEKNESGSVKIPYDKLDTIYETKTNFYLMIAKNQGAMISKEKMNEDCMNFIRTIKK